jgi:hypothetical protein
MNELIERMLPVGARSTPDDWLWAYFVSETHKADDQNIYPGLIVYSVAILRDEFTIRFHVTLNVI